MRNNRLVVEVVSQLIQRIDELENRQGQVDHNLEDVDKQVKRLAKELYKSNLMNGSSDERDIQDVLQELREQYAQRQVEAVTEARLKTYESFLPVIDSVEAGLKSGIRQVKNLQEQNREAARILYAWLKGQRLLRERLLKLLETENIHPMNAIGEAFDPYRHVAMKVVSIADKAPDTVVGIERPGYVCNDYVLRFANVIVNKSPEGTG